MSVILLIAYILAISFYHYITSTLIVCSFVIMFTILRHNVWNMSTPNV